jgi:hypothetical protein
MLHFYFVAEPSGNTDIAKREHQNNRQLYVLFYVSIDKQEGGCMQYDLHQLRLIVYN